MPLPLFTILSPIYSLLCDLNIVWVFKIIFPFFFSLTPLALYQLYQKLDFGDYKPDLELAALSVFVFVFFYGFYKDMPDKQHIAELFLTFILMLGTINIQTRVLLLIFSFSLVASHYGISYFFMISLILLFIINKFNVNGKFKINRDTCFLTPNYILLFSVFAFSWYLYFSGGYIFENIIQIGSHFLSTVMEIFESDRSGITYLFYESNSILWRIYKLIHIAFQFFIFVGILNLLTSIINTKTKSFEISLLSFIFYIFLFIQIFKSYGMGFDRVLQITLILLSPLSIWGFSSCIKSLTNIYLYIILKRSIPKNINENSHSIFESVFIKNKNNKRNISQEVRLSFAIFLMVFFIFNSGSIFEVSGDPLPEYCININTRAGWPVYYESEICGVNWLKSHEDEHNKIAVFNQWTSIKSRDGLLVAENFYSNNLIPIQPNTTKLYNSYIFLGNRSKDKIEGSEKDVDLKDTLFYKSTLKNSDKVYDSEKSHLYFVAGT